MRRSNEGTREKNLCGKGATVATALLPGVVDRRLASRHHVVRFPYIHKTAVMSSNHTDTFLAHTVRSEITPAEASPALIVPYSSYDTFVAAVDQDRVRII